MSKRTLPADAVDLLRGRHEAAKIAENLHAAYWLHHAKADGSALMLLQQVHDDFAAMAKQLGYTVTPIAASVEVAA